jgi:hypothetical protein
MALAKREINCMRAMKLALLSAGACLLFAPAVKAVGVTEGAAGAGAAFQEAAGTGNLEPGASGISPSSRPVLLADAICGYRSGAIRWFETKNYKIYICHNNETGMRTYVGVEKGNEKKSNVTLPIEAYDGVTFGARNGDVTYTINSEELVITQNGKVIRREKVIKSGRE